MKSAGEKRGYLVLVDLGLRIRNVCRIKWEGRQGRGRLEIVYEAGRWFALVSIEVGVEPPKSNKEVM